MFAESGGQPAGALPLVSLTVVELCENVAGPYAGQILSQLGAEVTKIERHGVGDSPRQWGPPDFRDEGVVFHVMNAGKRSVSLDLRAPQDHRQALELIDRADVVLQSWRPGVAERLGLDADALRRRNPLLVCCQISSFGDEGPLRDAPGYDPLMQAFSGLMSITGVAGAPPVRSGASITDMGTGMWAVIGMLAALVTRRTTQVGATVTTSLLETGLAMLPYQIAAALYTGEDPVPMGSGMPFLVPYQAFPTADGYLVVAAGNDRLWQRLCHALDRLDLADDPTLCTNPERVRQRDRLVSELELTFRSKGTAEWEAQLRSAGVPCSHLNTVGEAARHQQTAALGMIEWSRSTELPSLGLPFRIDGLRPRPTAPAPSLDAHGTSFRSERETAS